MPNAIWLLMFSLVPFHLWTVLSDGGMRLGGTGVAAALFQGAALIALFLASYFVFRSKRSTALKICFCRSDIHS